MSKLVMVLRLASQHPIHASWAGRQGAELTLNLALETGPSVLPSCGNDFHYPMPELYPSDP